MLTLQLNHDQKLELSKAFFNFGNIIGAAVIVNQAILGNLTFSTFIFGLFCFVIVFAGATLLLKTERN